MSSPVASSDRTSSCFLPLFFILYLLSLVAYTTSGPTRAASEHVLASSDAHKHVGLSLKEMRESRVYKKKIG